MRGYDIKALGQADRAPPAFFQKFADGADTEAYEDSEFLKILGVHAGDLGTLGHNADLVDAYNLIWNFRAAAHSSKIGLRPYASENATSALALAQAFWPSGKFGHVVPDYEQSLLLGNLDLDVSAGSIPVKWDETSTDGVTIRKAADGSLFTSSNTLSTRPVGMTVDTNNPQEAFIELTNHIAEMSGQTVSVTLADIDKARQTQAFGRLRAAYSGNDHTGYDADDAIVAELMQGFDVPDDLYKRPWLLDSQAVMFGMQERHATDGASLADSVTTGVAAATLSINVPKQDVGGVILITCEVLPEQLHERQGDPFLYLDDVSEMPNALRDIQRPEPVDIVPNWRIDARHSSPSGAYGYEPMNAKWDREYTRLGGKYYEATPGSPVKESRMGVWLVDLVDPALAEDHWLAPSPFPHDVFSDTLGDAVELKLQRSCMIKGITQIGDPLHEDNNDYSEVSDEQE